MKESDFHIQLCLSPPPPSLPPSLSPSLPLPLPPSPLPQLYSNICKPGLPWNETEACLYVTPLPSDCECTCTLLGEGGREGGGREGGGGRKGGREGRRKGRGRGGGREKGRKRREWLICLSPHSLSPLRDESKLLPIGVPVLLSIPPDTHLAVCMHVLHVHVCTAYSNVHVHM